MKNLQLTIPLLSIHLLVGLALAPHSAQADDRNSFYVYVNSSNRPETFSLNTLDKITFTDNSMKLWEDTKMTEIEFSAIDFLTLDEQQTRPIVTQVQNLDIDESISIKYDAKAGFVTIEGKEQLHGAAIYDLQGRLLVSDASASKLYRLSVAKVPRGIFLVRVTSGGKVKSQKLVK